MKKKLILAVLTAAAMLANTTAFVLAEETEAVSESEVLTETELSAEAPVNIFAEVEAAFAEMDAITVQEDQLIYQTETEAAETSEETEEITEAETEEQTGEVLYLLDEPAVYYALTPVYGRSLPAADAEILEILDLAEEVKAYAVGADHILISTDKGLSFVSSKYLTDSKEAADNAVVQEDAAIELAQQQAAAAAAAAAQASSSKKSSGGSGRKSSGKTIVSKENIPDCDGHGITIITYSDGSVETVDY